MKTLPLMMMMMTHASPKILKQQQQITNFKTSPCLIALDDSLPPHQIIEDVHTGTTWS